jgi:hypothetical protein
MPTWRSAHAMACSSDVCSQRCLAKLSASSGGSAAPWLTLWQLSSTVVVVLIAYTACKQLVCLEQQIAGTLSEVEL